MDLWAGRSVPEKPRIEVYQSLAPSGKPIKGDPQEKRLRTLLSGTDEPMKNLPIALAVAVLGTTLAGSHAHAQGRGVMPSRAGRGGVIFRRGPRARGHASLRGRVRRNFPPNGYAPYFYPSFGYD